MKETLDKSDDLPKDELIESLHKAKLDYDHVLKFASKTYNDLVIGNDSGLKKDQIGPFFRCDKLGHLARNCPNKTGNNNSDNKMSEKKMSWKRGSTIGWRS